MKRKWALLGLGLVVLLLVGFVLYGQHVGNPAVAQEITDNPTGERAGIVMLLTFNTGQKSTKTLPVNYLREGNTVFVGADGPWWREFTGEGALVSMLIRGETLQGHATVELEDAAYVKEVFARLRPTAPSWLPDWLNGKLVIIKLCDADPNSKC